MSVTVVTLLWRLLSARALASLSTAALVGVAGAILVTACGGAAATRSSSPPSARSSSPPSASADAGSAESAAVTSPTPGSRTPAPVQRSLPRPAGSAARSIPAPPSLIGLGVPRPVRIRIPAVGVDSGLSLLDRNPDGTIQLPPDLGQAGWYRRGVAPGDLGAAVIIGDVGSSPTPGVFSRLSGIRPGDAIRVQRDDGSELVFTVRRSLLYSPSAFPASEVYGVAAGAELRLITSGGTAASGSSPTPGDLVVFAGLSG
jgi:hypothetical protein